jgi:hypothetical protein
MIRPRPAARGFWLLSMTLDHSPYCRHPAARLSLPHNPAHAHPLRAFVEVTNAQTTSRKGKYLAQDHKPGATILRYRWTRNNIGREA